MMSKQRERYLKEGEIRLFVPGFNATARWNGHCERFLRFLDFKGVDDFAFFSADLPERAKVIGSEEDNEAFLDRNIDAQLDLISLASDRGWRYYMAGFKPDDLGMSSLRGLILVNHSFEEYADFAKQAQLEWFFLGGRTQQLEIQLLD